MRIDISNLDEENHCYAIHLAISQNIVMYENGTFKFSDVGSTTPFESVDFWRNISLSAEILLKACLLKHHVSFFRKRAHSEYGAKVTSSVNQWLQSELEMLEINYLGEINTGTVSTALKRAEQVLFEKLSIKPQESALIVEIFYIIIRTRRNRNTHFFFPNQSHIKISEVEMFYLPLLNKLEQIYQLQR